MDRNTFAERQAAMTANWFEHVKQREGDVDAYIAKRQAAYLDRWREAGRFIADGSRVLDVGGGNLYATLLTYIRSRQFDYFYIDVDPAAVSSSSSLAGGFGIEESHFSHGFNDRFAFPSDHFDAVFSSHCIEHSIDLDSTFSEVNRIVRSGGNLLMSVPLGWETNPEHPYFFAPNHWIALVEDAGFQIRVSQIGREYPEAGVDLFIGARKIGTRCPVPRLNPVDYLKNSYDFISHTDPRVSYVGDVTVDDEKAHLRGERWRVLLRLPKTREVLPVLHRHDWSGIVEFCTDAQTAEHDLFSWFPYAQPVRHHSALSSTLAISPVGRNPCSRSTEAVLYGFMVR